MTTAIKGYQREEGFTLIELMIVMVVIGILAGIVLFAIGTFQTDANTATTNTNKRICTTATAAYKASAANGTPQPWASYFDNDKPPSQCATAPALP
ncbi:MAG TPA: type II secretion system protein [Acidimicrobiales bacterium]|jgi:prepilin-type N-terminal cleavage/methylation domain-containing protein